MKNPSGLRNPDASAECSGAAALSFNPRPAPVQRHSDSEGPDVGVAFSVVIPAFNEEARLPAFLPRVVAYLESEFPNAHEIVVVDDGSTDGTNSWLGDQKRRHSRIRVVSFSENRGKGAAVRAGVMGSTGDLILFADADGATPISEEHRLRAAIRSGADVAVGSRLIPSSDVVVSRARSRGLAGRLFSAAARWMLRPPVHDTQCGFKMFRGDVGRRLASLASEDGYLFDLEWLFLARREGFSIAEVAVNWTEQPGSKLRVGRDGFKVLQSLGRLRRRLGASTKETS
jgi:dolichyl-phosphate beta-glucosyltransferase